MDGVPGLNSYAISRAAGILTDWRIVGRMGNNVKREAEEIARAGDLSAAEYQNRLVENFQFPDGRIVLPDYLSHHGTFLGAARFASLTAAPWQVNVEGAGATEVYVDGRRVLQSGGREGRQSDTFEVSPGPHHVLVKFAASSLPLRVAITPARIEVRPTLPSRASLQELTYLLAAGNYATGDFELAAQQIKAVPSAAGSGALQFLLAESLAHERGDRSHGRLERSDSDTLVPAMPTASEWARRVAVHPSCGTLRGAEQFYRAQGSSLMAAEVQQKLDGCAPESLDYAKSLSDQGRHPESAQALQRLILAAPLNRDARLMLVRELQLAGEDEAAQRAAAELLHVAPNAGDYRRLAAAVGSGGDTAEADNPGEPFYAPYRRDVSAIVSESALQSPEAPGALLVEDHVAIARADGSVSLYVHTVKRPASREPVLRAEDAPPSQGTQVLALRVVHANGTSAAVNDVERGSGALAPGDAVEEEYVINYAGDGGISEHCEAFQFVFGKSKGRVLHARFVVLTPAGQSDQGVVIATGAVPEMAASMHEGMLQRVWDNEEAQVGAVGPSQLNAGSAIVRVVEEENGWATPSSAEHQRRIETIHPGPRSEES